MILNLKHLLLSLRAIRTGDNESRESLLVAHSLKADGFDASEDGTGRGTPLIPVDLTNARLGEDVSGTLEASQDKHNRSLGVMGFYANDSGNDATEELSPTLRSMEGGGGGNHPAVCFDTTQVTSKTNRSNPKPGDPCHPLAEGAHPPAVALNLRGREGGSQFEVAEVASVRSSSGGSSRSYVQEMAVRRLMPVECEKLQGFYSGWTAIERKGKPAADGPRYRALGNSMAVPVLTWLGKRIAAQGKGNDAA